jgi:hypothetical protein
MRSHTFSLSLPEMGKVKLGQDTTNEHKIFQNLSTLQLALYLHKSHVNIPWAKLWVFHKVICPSGLLFFPFQSEKNKIMSVLYVV